MPSLRSTLYRLYNSDIDSRLEDSGVAYSDAAQPETLGRQERTCADDNVRRGLYDVSNDFGGTPLHKLGEMKTNGDVEDT